MMDRFYYDLHQALVYVRSIIKKNIRFEHTVDELKNFTQKALKAAGKELLNLTFNIHHMADNPKVYSTCMFVPKQALRIKEYM